MDVVSTTCDQVVMALRGIARALDLHYKYLLRNYGLSGPQIIVLKALEAKGPRPISEIARAVHLSQATVAPMLDRLEQRQFIVRTPGEHDRRQVFISLTDRGREMVQQAPALLHEKFLTEFTGLPLWEQTQILSALQRVAAMIGAPEEPDFPLLSIAPLPETETKSDAPDRAADKEHPLSHP